MTFLDTFLIVWVSTVSGVAITTVGPLTADACKVGKIAAQSRATPTTSVTSLCVKAR